MSLLRTSLIYHIYPDARWDVLLWNLVYLKAFIHNFDHLHIKVCSDNTERAREVLTPYFPEPTIDLCFYKNDKRLGETLEFISTLEKVKSINPNGLTFVAGASGVSKLDKELDNVKAWVKALYFLNLSNIKLVNEILQTTHSCFGSFIRRWPMYKGGYKPAPWHYAGTFFWLSNRELFKRNWRDIGDCRHGVEMYPGYQFSEQEAFNLVDLQTNFYLEEIDETMWADKLIKYNSNDNIKKPI